MNPVTLALPNELERSFWRGWNQSVWGTELTSVLLSCLLVLTVDLNVLKLQKWNLTESHPRVAYILGIYLTIRFIQLVALLKFRRVYLAPELAGIPIVCTRSHLASSALGMQPCRQHATDRCQSATDLGRRTTYINLAVPFNVALKAYAALVVVQSTVAAGVSRKELFDVDWLQGGENGTELTRSSRNHVVA